MLGPCATLVPHLCHTCATLVLGRRFTLKSMTSWRCRRLHSKRCRPGQAAKLQTQILRHWEDQYVSICFNGYRENIWSEDLNKDLVLLMIHTHLSKNCFFMFFFHLLACSEGCLCFVLKGVSANHQQSFSCVGIRLPQCPLYDLEGTDPATCSQ